MDDPCADPQELRKCHASAQRLTRLMGCVYAPVAFLERFSRSWPEGRKIRIVDFGTGWASIPREILTWADQLGWEVEITAIDRNPQTVAHAIEAGPPDSRLRIIAGDMLEMPFADGGFDYALASGVLHHLTDEQALAFMRMMDRVASRGVIISDPLRSRGLYLASFVLFADAEKMFRHDVLASIRQAFTRREVVKLRDLAGLKYLQYHSQYGHRFILAGEKNHLL